MRTPYAPHSVTRLALGDFPGVERHPDRGRLEQQAWNGYAQGGNTMGPGAVERVGAVLVQALAPGDERWALDDEGHPVVQLSARGASEAMAAHLRESWAEACTPRRAALVGPAPHVSYMTCEAMPRGVLSRLRLVPGLAVGTVDARHMHPATAAALGPVLAHLWASARVAAA